MAAKESVPLEEQIAYMEAASARGDDCYISAILASLRRVKELEADAARYQWMRNTDDGSVERAVLVKYYGETELRFGEKLDAAIDAARGSEG